MLSRPITSIYRFNLPVCVFACLFVCVPFLLYLFVCGCVGECVCVFSLFTVFTLFISTFLSLFLFLLFFLIYFIFGTLGHHDFFLSNI